MSVGNLFDILGWVMTFLSIYQAVSAVLLGLTDNYCIIVLIVNVILMLAGILMDVTPAILILPLCSFPL